MTYRVEGRLLEICTCKILCPCWVGEDPDGGTCDSSMAWHIDAGSVEGIDVSGTTIALAIHMPGNVLKGRWRTVVYIDDGSTAEQYEALLKVWTGKLGGAIADLAGLIGEVIAVERVPINFAVVDGKGTLTIGEDMMAEMVPLLGEGARPTTLHDSIFTTIPGAPAFVGKADHFWRDNRRHGLSKIDLEGHNAIQGVFVFEG